MTNPIPKAAGCRVLGLVALTILLTVGAGCDPAEDLAATPSLEADGATAEPAEPAEPAEQGEGPLAVGPSATQKAPPAMEPQRLSIGELRHIMEILEEPVLLVDVRSPESYAQRHARGAVSLPLIEVSSRAQKELPRDVLLVTYCT